LNPALCDARRSSSGDPKSPSFREVIEIDEVRYRRQFSTVFASHHDCFSNGDGEVVLAPDACHFCQTLHERRLPRNMYDREVMLASLDRLEALERSGAHLLRPRP